MTQLPTTQLPSVGEFPRVVSDHPAGREVVGREVVGREVVGREVVGREVVGREVVGGVDTHKDTHTAAALDERGRLLGCEQFPATPRGYQDLLAWLRGHTGGNTGGNGRLVLVGVEGTGAYGRGLTGLLVAEQVEVVEVDRPDRKTRRFPAASGASPTRSTPSPPPRPPSPGGPPAAPNTGRAGSRRCARCGSPAAPRSISALTCNARSKPWS